MPTVQEMLTYKRSLVGLVVVIFLISLMRLHTDTAVFAGRLYNRPSGPRLEIPDGPPRLAPIATNPGHTLKSRLPTLDIVVSMYKEDLNKTFNMVEELKALKPLKDLTITTYVYTKDNGADIEEIQHMMNTTHVAILTNVGREAGTYFSHILREWDSLARHTMFIQADMHEVDGAKNRILDWFTPDSGVLSLGQMESCDCVSCKDYWDESRTFPRLEELYSALNGEFCPKKIAITYLGQIVASASRIRSRGVSTYKYLKSVLESDMDHFIHADPKQGMFKDDSSNPYFGHTIERGYMVLWNCADEGIVRRCGGIDNLRARRTSDQPDDYCQCVDGPVS